MRRIGRDAHHRDAQGSGGGEIDIIIACASQREEPHARVRQGGKHRAVGDVVHEQADSLMPLHQCRGGSRQRCFEEIEGEAMVMTF